MNTETGFSATVHVKIPPFREGLLINANWKSYRASSLFQLPVLAICTVI